MLCMTRPAVALASLLSGCGNKGELFLVPDQMTQQELELLGQTLSNNSDSTLESVPVTASDDEEPDGSKKVTK